MRAVDTNVLVRLITRDDLKQTAAAEAFVKDGAWVSLLVLAEAVWVLDSVYEITPAALARAIHMILNHQHLTIQDATVVNSALANFTAHPALGFSDCLILAVATASGHQPLATFDRQLARLDGCQRI
jgi:predicted nucleic-acid-binding protein